MRPVDLLFPTLAGKIASHTCPFCDGPALSFRDEISRKEQTLSGLCQSCQDKTFSAPEEEED